VGCAKLGKLNIVKLITSPKNKCLKFIINTFLKVIN